MKRFSVSSHEAQEMIDVTDEVQRIVSAQAGADGLCVVYTPHTTAAMTINENADPDVKSDMLLGLERISPEIPQFKHFEHNSSAHLKASLIGSSVTLIVQHGRLVLGQWQGIYFCEFDGPRKREVIVKVM